MAKTMKTGVLIAGIVCAAFLAACGGGNSAFAGKWYLMEGEGRYIPEDMELLKDGAGFALEQAVIWKTEKNRFYITHPDLAMAFNYTVSGSRIDFTNDEGEKFVYMKKLGGPAALVGEWEFIAHAPPDGERIQIEEEDKAIIALNKDGTCITYPVSDATQTDPGKWAADKDTLYIIFDHLGVLPKRAYKIEGATLTLTVGDDEGEKYITELKRK